MEEFNVNDEDLRRAFNSGMGGGRRQNKNQATYGIFANSSDQDDGDFRAGFSSSSAAKYGKRTVTGVSFVKSSTTTVNKNKSRQADVKLVEDVDSDENEDEGGENKITDEEDQRTREVGYNIYYI